MRLLFLLLVISAFLNAEITLQEISKKPTSRAKDFLIWQYLKQDITNKEADAAYRQSTKHNKKLKRAYHKYKKDPYIIYKKACQKRRNLFTIDDDKCFKLALSPYKTLAMSHKERVKLSKKVDSPKFIKLLKIQSEPYSTKAYRSYSADTILRMFIHTTSKHRIKNLNIYLDKKFINKLSSSKKIHYFIRMVMNDNRLNKLQKSLLLLKPKNLNVNDNFFLALHQLKYNRTHASIKHLKIAYLKSKKSLEKDKINFWLYKVSKNKKYLKILQKSSNINIYTLYAHDKLNTTVHNYYSILKTNNLKSKMDLKDPFIWEKLRKNIKKTPKNRLFGLTKK